MKSWILRLICNYIDFVQLAVNSAFFEESQKILSKFYNDGLWENTAQLYFESGWIPKARVKNMVYYLTYLFNLNCIYILI